MPEKVEEVMFFLTFRTQNYFLTQSVSAIRFNLDLIELYLYKLLESIGVGAKIIFIPNCVASKSIIYIASEWISDLKTFHSTELGQFFHSIL